MFIRGTALLAFAALASIGCARENPLPPPNGATSAPLQGCLDSGDGYLRARLRGAMDMDLAWRNDEMECTGGTRPDGSGLRVSIAGPAHSDGRRMRFVFGISESVEGIPAKALPTNVTVIFEGEQRMYATRGDDKCTSDDLSQQRVGALGGPARTWRIEVRGFCTEPAASLVNDTRLLLTSFDFAGRIVFEEQPGEERKDVTLARR